MTTATNIFDLSMKRLGGDEQSLADYRGKVLLLVNVASQCGNTPQYEGLQDLYEQFHDRGLEILGFPANAPLRSTMCRRCAPSSSQCCAIAAGSSENTVADCISPCFRRTQ